MLVGKTTGLVRSEQVGLTARWCMTDQGSGCASGEDAVCAPTTSPCLTGAASTGVSARGARLGPAWNEAVLDQADRVTGLDQVSRSWVCKDATRPVAGFTRSW